MIAAKLILFLPLLAAIFVGLQSRTMHFRWAQVITTSCVFLSAILSAFMFHDVAIEGNKYNYTLVSWIASGAFKADWAIKIDSLTAIMLCVVTFVSSLVHLFSIGYMAEDAHKQRFMAYLSLFTFFMLILVTADNFIQMFVGWEGVGLCSYLLIGFWFKKASANAAAIKAFVVNRVGDFGFVLGIAAVFVIFDSVKFDDVFALSEEKNGMYFEFLGYDIHAITLAAFLLFVGAMGKSAQLGLHTWLPDAMEGPTPVSALIHAATMVTAGVFMLARISPMLEYSPAALAFITVVGALTAIFAATIALTQNDIKKVIAYSTCSQLGYMIFACGLSVYAAGIFHLATHAFFKALLFLGAGSVIHAMHHEQDMRNYGGLWKKIPWTYAYMAIGSLAIIGMPGLSGYYSKEAIVGAAYNDMTWIGDFAFYVGTLTAILTAFYSARLFFLTFHGKPRDKKHYDKAHESPLVMTIPLFLLSVGAIAAGYYGSKALGMLDPSGEFWNGSIAILSEHNPMEHLHIENKYVAKGSKLAILIAVILGLVIYAFKLGVAEKLKNRLKPLYNLSLNKWYIDELYDKIFVKPYFALSKKFWIFWDTKIIDGIPNGVAHLSEKFAGTLSDFQSGYIYQYAFVIVVSVVSLISYYILF